MARQAGATVVLATHDDRLLSVADVLVTATRDPGCMLAAWLVGTEH
ncbi:MAG: hypothetical protein WBG36_07425 [Ornithinimicrobium sp.]